MDADIKRPGEEEAKNLVDIFHGWPKQFQGWNELFHYSQTNNAYRKNKFINFNLDDYTLLPPIFGLFEGIYSITGSGGRLL